MAQTNASLYVGNLGEEINEHTLYEHFKEIGPIVSVRVCMDAHDTHKSLRYGYVNFQNPADAENAVERLNCSKLGQTYIRVSRIERDPSKRRLGQNNLVVRHLPAEFDVPELKDLFGKYGTISSLHVATDETGRSRGYAHVQFSTPEAAKVAIEEANDLEIGGQKISVVPYNHNYQDERRKNFTNTYVRNISTDVTNEKLAAAMGKFGAVTSAVVRVDADGTHRRFGFCNFESHESAMKAIEECNEKVVAGLSQGEEAIQIARFMSRNERMREREKRRQARRAENAKYPSLYVKNFNEDTTEEMLRNIFSRCGEVIAVHIMRDRTDRNISRGFGFVAVKDHETVMRCTGELHGSTELGSKPLYVSVAMRRDARRAQMQQSLMQQRRMPMPMGPMGNMFGQRMNYNMPPNMMMQPNMMGPRMNQRPMRPPMRQPVHQMPAPHHQPQPQPPQQQSLSNLIANMNPEQAKNTLGERVYNYIMQRHPNEAAKVTGMLLEMDNAEIISLLEHPDQLESKVAEALDVLARHSGM